MSSCMQREREREREKERGRDREKKRKGNGGREGEEEREREMEGQRARKRGKGWEKEGAWESSLVSQKDINTVVSRPYSYDLVYLNYFLRDPIAKHSHSEH